MRALRAALLLLVPAYLASAQTASPALRSDQTQTGATAHVQARIEEVSRITSKLPRVDVTHTDFGAGCPNAADRAGQLDSTCAIRNALRFAQANPVEGGGFPILYFPHGRYLVAGTGYTAALTFNNAVSMMGDGAQSTTILNTSATAGSVAYNTAGDCAHKPGPCFTKIEGITFAGRGHTSMGGLIEINNTAIGLIRDVVLAESGGIGLNFQGSSERWIVSQVEIDQVRWGVLTEGDTNEDYFDRVNVINNGQDLSHFCFSVNCPGGRLISGGTWLPDPHSAVYLDGDNLHWMNSSIKSTANIGGIHLAAVTSSVTHTYIEGFPYAGQPRTNHAIELGGKLELGHLTQATGAADLQIPVDDAGWQPLYVNDPALAFVNGSHSYTPFFNIFPADYLFGSREPSRAVPGITRGTLESVKVASFAGDGRAHLLARAQDGTKAVAWPAGSVIEQVPQKGYGMSRVESNHVNSVSEVGDRAHYTSGCDDTALLTQWTSNPSRLCADIIVGLVPDGYGVPLPSQHFVGESYSADIVDNVIFIGQNEAEGAGWIKIPGNGTVRLEEGDGPLGGFTPADTALTTYENGITRLKVIQYGDTSAIALVNDPAAGVSFSSQARFFHADVLANGSLGHEYLGEQCWYPAPATSQQQPTSRFCVRASGPAQETLVSGRWVPSSK